MPDIPIDQAVNLTSLRLKVPTGTVPVPPPGHLQLHAPDYETLAFRRGDGSVVEIGGGGAPGDTIAGDGGMVSTGATPGHDPGVVLSPSLGKTIWLNGPVVGPEENQPFGVQVATVPVSSAEILALHSNPKVLVAAITGKLLVPVSAAIRAVPGATLYTGAAELWLGHLSPVPGNGVLAANQETLNGGPVPPNLDYFFATWVSAEQDGYPIVGVPFAVQLGGPVAAGNGTMVITVAYLVV